MLHLPHNGHLIVRFSKKLRRTAQISIVYLCGVAVFTACSAAEPEPGIYGTGNGWGDVIQQISNEGDDFVKAVLADGVISDMEVQESLKKIEACYAGYNATVSYDKYGFESVHSLDGKHDPLKIMGECAFADGGIFVLHDQMRRNPKNQDTDELVAACLVRKGIVEQGFTGQDLFDVWHSDAELPWPRGDKRVELCGKDPLGIISDDAE